MRFRRLFALLAALTALAAILGPFGYRALLWRWEQNPILSGFQLAREQGCLGCHQPDAGREIPNPRSRWGTVPRFRAGNSRMYASSLLELEEFIRFGAPRSWLDDPAVVRRLGDQRVRMPAYGQHLTEGELADLVSFAGAMEALGLPGGEAVDAGRQLAREHGCTSCHGLEGAGGMPNPGSLGGFVPGFLGRNFEDLVLDREEFEEWIRTGSSRRLQRSSLVRFFWRRQRLSMPAYGEDLDESQIDALWTWVQAMREFPAR